MKTALLFSSVLLLLLSACSTPAPDTGPSATTPVSTTATTTITPKSTTSRGNKNLKENKTKDKDKSGLKFQPGPSGGDSLTLKGLGEITSSLTRVQLIRVIKAARPGLVKCSRRLRDSTSYRLTVTVSGTGKVSSVTMDTGTGTPLETCVRAVWSRMIFPAFKRPAITFNYLFRAPAPSRTSPAKDAPGGNPDQKVNTGHKRDGEGSEDL